MPERSDRYMRRAGVLVIGLACGLASSGLGGCASGNTAQARQDRQRAAELGLSSDAEDPTAREKREGYGIWREKDETTGTRDPMTPERRNLRWD